MIRDEATQAQIDAADPQSSTWLSANAGSGKTRVLTDRVARLLLAEVEPQNILCLTYTKAAAAEMQNRLFQRLGAWAMQDDATLRSELMTLGVEGRIDVDRLSKARTLFASAIETPGGLKIQTIHSFCAAILRRFPLEARVSPQFREMEDRQAALLRTEVLDDMSSGPHRDTVLDMLAHFTGAELDSFVAEITGKRGRFAQGFDAVKMRKTLGLDPDVTLEQILDQVFDRDSREIIKDTITMLRTGTTNDLRVLDKLITVNLANPGPADMAILEGAVLTSSGNAPYTAKIKALPTKALREANPELTEALHDLMLRVQDLRQTRLSLGVLARTTALYAFATHFVAAYDARKLAMGMLDFDDLITKARDLLSDPKVADWVLYRLDGGIDHVLVDEAQDTSPAQWAVIEHLTREFASGEGARADQQRTVFVVGDKKQSIYSFQGADPDEFDRMRNYFAQALAASQDRLEERALAHSFRSSQTILRVVDSTFTGDRAAGLEKDVRHVAFKDAMPGRVDIWPAIEPSKAEDKKGWLDPVDGISDHHHNVQLAHQVASQIKHMIQHESLPQEIGNTGEYISRNITEGDFLILVQRRSDLFSEIIRACKQMGLDIAGADRLRVGAELAVKDIAALLAFLALPEDDLSLACALRSPLFGWTEKQLYDLAQPRPERGYLWAALRDSDRSDTLAILNDLRDQADFLRPFDLIERILTRHDGRRNLLARLGSEAEDGIDALLSQALSYEQTGVPSLTGFLVWLETDAVEIKRQMDAQGDRIRVMTVHGAKGLEAPIVILPECQKRRNEVKATLLEADDLIFWKPVSDQQPQTVRDVIDDITQAQNRERMRLLYVAMTRAEKWLIVAAAGDVGAGDDSWYSIAANGAEHSGAFDAMSGPLPIRRVADLDWQIGDTQFQPKPVAARVTTPEFAPLPQISRQTTLSPSAMGGEKIVPGDPAGGDVDAALARGEAMHLLLEHLPGLAPDQRIVAGRTLLGSLPAFHDASTVDALIADAVGIIENPALAHIFGSDVLVEIGITATMPEPDNRRIHGTIDRLIVGADSVLCVDFKTNRLVPDRPEDTPEGVLRQQGAYAHALAQIYPNHRIETAILWTQTARLMPLPTPLVAAALGRVTTS